MKKAMILVALIGLTGCATPNAQSPSDIEEIRVENSSNIVVIVTQTVAPSSTQSDMMQIPSDILKDALAIAAGTATGQKAIGDAVGGSIADKLHDILGQPDETVNDKPEPFPEDNNLGFPTDEDAL